MTAYEKRYLGAVAEMGCIACEQIGFHGTLAQVHHVRVKTGWGRDGHLATIPLCYEHHQGATGVHTLSREQFANLFGRSEIEMMEIVRERLKDLK